MLNKNDIEVREYHDVATASSRYSATLTMVAQGHINDWDKKPEVVRHMGDHLITRLWNHVYGDVVKDLREFEKKLKHLALPWVIFDDLGAIIDTLEHGERPDMPPVMIEVTKPKDDGRINV